MYATIFILSITIWGEGRSETLEGQEAIGWAIVNRANDSTGRWPNTPEEVCVQDRQFSVWNNRDPNRGKMVAVDTESHSYQTALWVATGVLSGHTGDPTGGATHYHHENITPNWADSTKLTAHIGVHKFYKGIP